MTNLELKATLSMAVLNAKIKAIKATLTEDQILVFNESMAASKAKYLSCFDELSTELRTLVDQSFLE